MKKLLAAALLMISCLGYGQGEPQSGNFMSPQGMLDLVFDQYGKSYKLSDIMINGDVTDEQGEVLRGPALVRINCGYFDLYLEPGCGMENAADPLHLERRDVICRVFTDLSNFIASPLTQNGNRVNIFVRNINNITPNANGVLGLATAFYNLPSNTTSGFGGIADNEVWKTIHAGVDSFTNVASPIFTNTIPSGQSGLFYHGMMSFNFNSYNSPPTNSPAIFWNTNLGINAPSGRYDLYTVVLHEVTHALGFQSMINQNGLSKFGTGFNYFTRYDRFLMDNRLSANLIVNKRGECSMYNYNFNTALNNSILRPGCTTPGFVNNGNPLNATLCNDAIKYMGGAFTVPVYTPKCFEPPSSLSHFEDQLFPTCGSPYGNDAHFTMSNALGAAVTKRYLRQEERTTLCDIGYRTAGSYGHPSTFNGTFTYNGDISCKGIITGGINDGLNPNGTFTFTGPTSATPNISISGILNNDHMANGFQCLEDVFFPGTTTLSTTSGTAATTIHFNSTTAGVHLLRYVPVGTDGLQGNITYIYVNVGGPVTSCGEVVACNLVSNGRFEQFVTLPDYISQIERACGWFRPNPNATPDYHYANPAASLIGVPCNFRGHQTDAQGGNGYAGMYITDNPNPDFISSETIGTQLITPLSPNTTYQLSFDVSLADYTSAMAVKFQAYLSPTPIVTTSSYLLPIADPTMLFEFPVRSTVANGWQRIYFNVTTGATAGQQYLYIGGLNNVDIQANPNAASVPGCVTGYVSAPYSYYYVDNVSILEMKDTVFNLPTTACQTTLFPDLRVFLNPAPVGGVFTGPGVTFSGGLYSFNAAVAGVGNHTITYTYTNSEGCSISVFSMIMIEDCTSNCVGDMVFITTEPATPGVTYQAANSITTMTNYVVNLGSDVTLKAGNAVSLKPNSHLKAGSKVLARIEECSPSLRAIAEASSVNEETVRLYPNPAKSTITISTHGDNLKNITVYSIDGKLVLDQDIEKQTAYQLDVAHYQNGIYLALIETENGTIYREKIMKN